MDPFRTTYGAAAHATHFRTPRRVAERAVTDLERAAASQTPIAPDKRREIIAALKQGMDLLHPHKLFYLFWACVKLDINLSATPWMIEADCNLTIGQRLIEVITDPANTIAIRRLPPQDLPKMLRTLAIASQKYGDNGCTDFPQALQLCLDTLSLKIETLTVEHDMKHIFSLLQTLPFLRHHYRTTLIWPLKINRFLDKHSALRAEEAPSTFETNVLASLRRLYPRLEFQAGLCVNELHHTIDIAVTLDDGRKIAIEVDGPQHFYDDACEHPTTRTWLRDELLKIEDWEVVSITRDNPTHLRKKLDPIFKPKEASTDDADGFEAPSPRQTFTASAAAPPATESPNPFSALAGKT